MRKVSESSYMACFLNFIFFFLEIESCYFLIYVVPENLFQ